MQSQCVVEMDPTDQLCFMNDKSVVFLGSGAVEKAVALVVDKTLTSEVEVLLETSVTSDPTVNTTWSAEAVREEQAVMVHSALKSSGDGQVRSTLIELSPNKEMKQDATERDGNERGMNEAKEETDSSKDETDRAKEELDNANSKDEVHTNLDVVNGDKINSCKVRIAGSRLTTANDNEHWIDQNCKRQWYKVWDPGGSENLGQILHERE